MGEASVGYFTAKMRILAALVVVSCDDVDDIVTSCGKNSTVSTIRSSFLDGI